MKADRTQHRTFPRLKFKAPHKLGYKDAGVALRVSVTAAQDALSLFGDHELVPVYEMPGQEADLLGLVGSADSIVALIK